MQESIFAPSLNQNICAKFSALCKNMWFGGTGPRSEKLQERRDKMHKISPNHPHPPTLEMEWKLAHFCLDAFIRGRFCDITILTVLLLLLLFWGASLEFMPRRSEKPRIRTIPNSCPYLAWEYHGNCTACRLLFPARSSLQKYEIQIFWAGELKLLSPTPNTFLIRHGGFQKKAKVSVGKDAPWVKEK